MSTFLQQLINGISLGAIYALIALGYTMVYGILRLINFAHGDVYMGGAFMGYYLAGGIGIRGAQMLMGNPDANIVSDRAGHHAFGDGYLRRPGRAHRTTRLPARPKILAPDCADHRDRRFAAAREWRPGSLWRRPEV